MHNAFKRIGRTAAIVAFLLLLGYVLVNIPFHGAGQQLPEAATAFWAKYAVIAVAVSVVAKIAASITAPRPE